MNSSQQRSRFWQFLVLATILIFVPGAIAAGPGFAPQARVGFTEGDQWEPAIAADAYNHVYILYPQYGTMPGCATCAIPTLTLVVSSDNGTTFQAPRAITPPGTGQFDPQIVVDPNDRRTVYAAWLQDNKTDVAVAKSSDFGQSWSVVLAAKLEDIDKPTLAVRGSDVYVAFNHDRRMWVAASHDGGLTFTSSTVASAERLTWALPGGGTIDNAGTVYFAWSGYTRHGARAVNLYVSRSNDGGQNWINTRLDTSGTPPDCSASKCGWNYLGAQITMTSDNAGTLFALWNAGTADRSPERIYFSSSTTGGSTWSPKANVSEANPGVEHAFPAITAGPAGDVRIAWMDTRSAPQWNTFYRSSTNGGATWSAETRLFSPVSGYSYIKAEGFAFPFGDYFGLAIDARGQTQAVWGEGLNFKSPGSIWYTSGH